MASYFTDADRLRWVSDGQLVLVPWNDKGAALRCVVVKACGTMALVENVERGFSRWIDVTELFPNITDEQMRAWKERRERT